MDTEKLSAVALNVADSAGAGFADMRIVEERQNRVFVQRRSLKLVDEVETSGFSVRVLLDGAWGFAASSCLDTDEVARTAQLAVDTAKASASVPKPGALRMSPESGVRETCAGSCGEDPFSVPNSDKAALLLEACNTAMDQPGIVQAQGGLQFIRQRRVIANTDGSLLDLTNTFANPSLSVTAVVDGESQSRSYQRGAKQAGYEFIRAAALVAEAERCAREAVIKCRADESPRGVMDLVLDPHHLALTMHESVGHPTELDRILGWEANMAGRSFVKPEHVGHLRYGSDVVNFTVDNTLADGVGSWFFDDDGVRMRAFPLVKSGVLVNLACTRETAPLIGWERSTGCCRAAGHANFPINRIPNLYLEPGADENVTPDDLVADVERGIYIEGMGSFSIDQMRNNFQFGGDFFWLIENGKRTRPLKKVTYQAQTRDFWRSCDGIAGRPFWESHGLMNCGKGEPMQIMRMTHGASPTRFRNIQVGDARL